MRLGLRNQTFHLIIALLAGLGLGLAYSWKLSPVTYVDASPAILRADFKDQYRIVIAASYASTQDMARARARLELLGDTDPVGALSAQAQRMLAAGESFERVRPIAQLATDLQQGFVSIPFTGTPFTQIIDTLIAETPFIEGALTGETPLPPEPTLSFEGTQLAPPPDFTATPRPTPTPIPAPGAPFMLVGQDTVCDPTLNDGLLQIMLMDSRRRQVPGVKIIVTWEKGESQFFTGLKPELGNGYADFLMKSDTIYSVRLMEGGSFVPNLSAPSCTNANGGVYFRWIVADLPAALVATQHVPGPYSISCNHIPDHSLYPYNKIKEQRMNTSFSNQKPGLLTAIAVMTLTSGITNLFWGFIASATVLSTIVGIVCLPITILPTILGVFEIIYAAKLLSTQPQPVQPSPSIAVFQILTFMYGNIFSMVVGILNLIFFNDQAVKEYFSRINGVQFFTPSPATLGSTSLPESTDEPALPEPEETGKAKRGYKTTGGK